MKKLFTYLAPLICTAAAIGTLHKMLPETSNLTLITIVIVTSFTIGYLIFLLAYNQELKLFRFLTQQCEDENLNISKICDDLSGKELNFMNQILSNKEKKDYCYKFFSYDETSKLFDYTINRPKIFGQEQIDFVNTLLNNPDQQSFFNKIYNLNSNQLNFLKRLTLNENEYNGVVDLINSANFRGYYGNLELRNQVFKYYSTSETLKIKVTRGSKLFAKDGIFDHCFKSTTGQDERKVQLLLHMPCLASKHIESRAKTNDLTTEKYIQSLFELLIELQQHTDYSETEDNIEIRFYTDHQIKWRYYIMQHHKSKERTLFLNHYNENISGSKSWMMKIKSGTVNLCDQFNSEFDEIFKSSTRSKPLIVKEKNNWSLIENKHCKDEESNKLIKDIFNKVFNK